MTESRTAVTASKPILVVDDDENIRESLERGLTLLGFEVQSDNLAAQRLYRRLGFEIFDAIAHLRLPARKRPVETVPPSLALRPRRPDDWRGLHALFHSAIPAAAQEIRPLRADDYRLGVLDRLVRGVQHLLHVRGHFDWVLEQGGQIVALLRATIYHTRTAHSLRLTVHLSSRGSIEEELLAAGLNNLSRFPGQDIVSMVSASHREAQLAFDRTGFQTVRLLDQMRLNFNRH